MPLILAAGWLAEQRDTNLHQPPLMLGVFRAFMLDHFRALTLLFAVGITAVVGQTTPTLWSTPIVPLAQTVITMRSPFDGKHVIVPQDSGSIVSLDADTGAVEWTYNGLNTTGQTINQINVIPMQAVVVWAATGIVGLDPNTGRELWTNTTFLLSTMLATEDAILVYANSPPSLVAISPATGQILYTNSLTTVSISQPIGCGLGLACWMQFPDSGGNGQAVVFDLKAGSVLRATTLPIASVNYVKHFRATDFHIIVVYDQYVDFWRFGIAIAAVDLFNGAIGWSYSLPLAGASGSYPLAIGDGVVSLLIDLQNADGLTSTLNLNGFDQRTGAVVLNSTFNYTTTNPYPMFSEIHEGRIWIGQIAPLRNLTAFDMVTGQPVSSFMAPITGSLAPTANVYISGASGPRWVIPNLVGVTVWNALNGAFVSRTTTVEGITGVQQTFDGKVILTTTTAVVALQP